MVRYGRHKIFGQIPIGTKLSIDLPKLNFKCHSNTFVWRHFNPLATVTISFSSFFPLFHPPLFEPAFLPPVVICTQPSQSFLHTPQHIPPYMHWHIMLHCYHYSFLPDNFTNYAQLSSPLCPMCTQRYHVRALSRSSNSTSTQKM